jgi:predicted heme/steroid binding protein
MSSSTAAKVELEEENDPPRNFTLKQLLYFDGTKDPSGKEDKPVYISVAGTVFDMSEGREFYGKLRLQEASHDGMLN